LFFWEEASRPTDPDDVFRKAKVQSRAIKPESGKSKDKKSKK
jgi:hypothetical protein